MAKAVPPRPAAAPARPVARPQSNTLSPLRITYYRRMHLQHVYAVTVGWNSKDRPAAAAKPVTLRLLMAGAQIVPSEQRLDPAKPDASVNFYVTPLARGHLYGERLEVLIDDRKVQEIPLSCKVTSQRLTFFLLAMSFVIPWLLLHYTKYSYLTPRGEERELVRRTPGTLLEYRLQQNLPPVPDFIAENSKDVAEFLEELPGKVSDFYELLWVHNDKPLAVYALVALLALTLLSWLMRRVKRKRRIGPPIPLAAATVADDDED